MEPIQISSVNQYAFCPRRCALINIEGIWADNEHTIQGALLHEHVNEAGYENLDDKKALRALPIYSTKYNITGKADVVEIHGDELVPVEYKKGKRRKYENDEIQLCAQSLCLEEMFQTTIRRGYIYHISSNKRREVIIDENLRKATIEAIEKTRELLESGIVPEAHYRPCCDECSLYQICLPQLTDPLQRLSALQKNQEDEEE